MQAWIAGARTPGKITVRSLLFAASLLLAGNAHAWTDLSFYGDSFVFRSGWTCAGMNLTPQQCSDLRTDSSFVTHVPYPYGYTATPAFGITHVDGIGAGKQVEKGRFTCADGMWWV